MKLIRLFDIKMRSLGYTSCQPLKKVQHQSFLPKKSHRKIPNPKSPGITNFNHKKKASLIPVTIIPEYFPPLPPGMSGVFSKLKKNSEIDCKLSTGLLTDRVQEKNFVAFSGQIVQENRATINLADYLILVYAVLRKISLVGYLMVQITVCVYHKL